MLLGHFCRNLATKNKEKTFSLDAPNNQFVRKSFTCQAPIWLDRPVIMIGAGGLLLLVPHVYALVAVTL
jgi:hypothetical protein